MSSPLHRSSPHESARQHVTGTARYIDDQPEPPGMLHGWLVTSPVAHGTITRLDVSDAAAEAGITVLTAADIPGKNRIGPIVHDEPVLAEEKVFFVGQPVAIVFGPNREAARLAAAKVILEVDELPAILGIDAAIAEESFLTDPHIIRKGDVEAALAGAHLVVDGTVETGAQDHFYLEGQVAVALPDEAHTMTVLSSTQHPTEVQKEVATVLGWPSAAVVCKVPRLGGGFGGKESQASGVACLAALGAQATGRAVKLRLERNIDMQVTGNRHPFKSWYRAGFAEDGQIVAFEAKIFADGGWTTDLTGPIVDRGLFHLENAYKIDNLHFEGRGCRTHIASNTAFRGFGGPQGMFVVEEVINRASEQLGLDPAQVRQRNFVQDGDACAYGQVLSHVRIGEMTETLLRDSRYAERRAEIDAFNAHSRFIKRGIGFQPLKFGISFTASVLNQAGALVLVYTDGSVQLNHGGTEMGQGLHTKMRAVAADVFGLSTDRVRLMTTATDKVPNTSATAASSGSDLNGQAVRIACETVRERMATLFAGDCGCTAADVTFADGQVICGSNITDFASLATRCWAEKVSLSATGYYATPGIGYDPSIGRGTPFFYFAYGTAVTEVELDTRTGQFGLRRVDVLHDCGASLVPSIDKGQVEGGYVQGLGWLTVEEWVLSPAGKVLTHGPSTYKIPAAGDIPAEFNVRLLDERPQPGVIGGSKAVGEPPFMLAISAVTALRHAIGAVGNKPVHLTLPATHEAVLEAVEAQR